MRSMQWQLGVLGTISAFAFRHRETKKNLCRGGCFTHLERMNRRVGGPQSWSGHFGEERYL
jgi:hypothetical protein